MGNRPIALVVALARERQAIQPALSATRACRLPASRAITGVLAGQAVLLIQAGMGADRARAAVLDASRRFSLGAAWSLGFAGGLAEGLAPGDLLCPPVVLRDAAGQPESLPAAPAQAAVIAALQAASLPLRSGSLLTVSLPLRTPGAKRAAHSRTGAVAVDMEATGVAEAARGLGIPWLALKAVVDGVEEPLPEFLSGCTTAGGALRWRGLLRSLLAGERRRVLRRLARSANLAARSLSRSLDVAVRAWVTTGPAHLDATPPLQ